MIGEIMGNTDPRHLQRYLASFGQEKKDKAMENLEEVF